MTKLPHVKSPTKKKKNTGGLNRQQTKEFNTLIEMSKHLLDEIHGLEGTDDLCENNPQEFYQIEEFAETDEIMAKFDAEF